MKSKLDELLEVLKDMTDEEIVEATSNISKASCGELGDLCAVSLQEIEWAFEKLKNTSKETFEKYLENNVIAPFEPKSKKEMVCITKERYEELLKMEQLYIDMCDL